MKQVFINSFKGIVVIGVATALLLGMVALTGCDETQNMIQPVINEPADTTPPVMVGEVKEEPEETTTEPEAEQEETPTTEQPEKTTEEETPAPEPEVPMVPAEEIEVEVNYYNDEALTDNLAAALYADVWDPTFDRFSPGDTVYATATFSHPLPVVEQVNPTLFMTLNSEEITRFTPTTGTLTPGTYKEDEDENRYVCKYTVPDGAFGILHLVVEIGERTITGELRLQAVLSFVCPVDTTAGPAGTRSGATDFVGQVLTPRYDPPVIPLEGVRVTVMAGPHTGASTFTNQEGEFVFPDIAEDELHIHLEKECYEPKEMLVFRSSPTALPDGTVLRYRQNNRHRNTPGVVLMGHAWPDPVRPLLEQMTLPHDLLYFQESFDSGYNYYNSNGVVIISSNEVAPAVIDRLLVIFAHELFHAHQHATVSIDGSGNIFDWENTPDGRAYAEAQRKDREAFGESSVDVHSNPILLETSARTAARFLWSITATDADRERRETSSRYQELKNNAPHRLRWAQEWHEKEKMKRN